MKYILLYIFFCFFSIFTAFGQQQNEKVWFFEPEFMLGKIVSNYDKFPKSPFQSSFFINIGRINYSSNNLWSGFYNYPSTGISAAYSNYGNDSILGSQFSLMPFLEVNTSRYKSSSFCFKFGLGSSYFTTHYNKLYNKTNKAIGSHFNWAFQLFLYYKININNNLNLKMGAGYLHSSNGHTQLPNYGLNSGMLSLSAQYFFTSLQPKPIFEPNYLRHYIMSVRSGIGMHEYGTSKGPVGGAKRPIYSIAASGGIVFKQNIIVHAGLAYRFYQQYYNYITTKLPNKYDENPRLNSSNIYFFLGSEFLIGHASIDIEGGINLFKPFRNTYEERTKSSWLKDIFPSRMGLKLYAINTSKMPCSNVYVSAHINANFGQADFSEISLGFVHLIK